MARLMMTGLRRGVFLNSGCRLVSSLAAPAVGADLPPVKYLYGYHNEDARVELALIKQLAAEGRSNMRVLSVASCGTHTIAMCSSPDIARVDSVDPSAGQIMLSELTKAAAIGLSTTEELAAFLGTGGDPDSRVSMYEETVRKHLAPSVATFWDENVAIIRWGTMVCGGADRLYSELRRRLPSTDDWNILREDAQGVEKAVMEGFSHESLSRHMGPLLTAAQVDRIAGFLPPLTSKGLNGQLAGWKDGDVKPMVTQLCLAGKFSLELDKRLLFLQPHILASAQELGIASRVFFHQGLIQAEGLNLAETTGQYDIVDISNILDLLESVDQSVPLLTEVLKCAKPGKGVVLGRWANTPGFLKDAFTAVGMKVDEKLSKVLTLKESSFVMTEVCVGRAP